jgi:hypothetical protein
MCGKFFLSGDFLSRHILATREWTQYSTIEETMVKKTGIGKEESAMQWWWLIWGGVVGEYWADDWQLGVADLGGELAVLYYRDEDGLLTVVLDRPLVRYLRQNRRLNWITRAIRDLLQSLPAHGDAPSRGVAIPERWRTARHTPYHVLRTSTASGRRRLRWFS